MATRIQLRRDTAANWTTNNPTLAEGEVGFEKNTNKFKIGNGLISWAGLEYFGGEVDLSEYLTIASASSTYLTKISASTTYATKTELNNIDALPSQSGNSGKYLTTSGSVASWSTIDLTSAINTASAAAVTYLVDSAPAALDTLNELAAALGDDANYASTITTALGTKAPLASPTFTGSVTTGEAITKTTSTAIASSSATTIATFPITGVIVAECIILISNTSNGSYYASKVLITADPYLNAEADITEYAINSTKDFDLFPVITATISGENLLLRAAVSSFGATTAKVVSTSILGPLGSS
jgi:hypothetical protein